MTGNTSKGLLSKKQTEVVLLKTIFSPVEVILEKIENSALSEKNGAFCDNSRTRSTKQADTFFLTCYQKLAHLRQSYVAFRNILIYLLKLYEMSLTGLTKDSKNFKKFQKNFRNIENL